VLTATGVGTLAADGRQMVEVGGRAFLIEPALTADVALFAARSADYAGNLVHSLTARNSADGMAAATVDRRGRRSCRSAC
jgi:acetate CoA/acetoacetate CoA-transferase alpha subunit